MSNQNQNQQQAPVPAYTKLVAQIQEAAQQAGVPLRSWELKNYVGFESAINAHKLYVPKNAGDVGMLHTTLWIERAPGRVTDLPKGPGSIGKIESFVAPDIEVVKALVLPLMTASEGRLRANRKPTRRKTGEQPVARPQGSDADLTAGMTDEELAGFIGRE